MKSHNGSVYKFLVEFIATCAALTVCWFPVAFAAYVISSPTADITQSDVLINPAIDKVIHLFFLSVFKAAFSL